MKKIIILLLAMSGTAILTAQSEKTHATSGRITYEEKVKLNIKIEGESPEFANKFPKERKSEKILIFTSDATLFEDGASKVTEDEMASSHDEGGVRIRIAASGDNKTYTDLKNKKIIEQRDFMNRIFLVEKEAADQGWKVTGQQKDILGYSCYEAMKQDTAGNKTIAWFAPGIKVSSGPAGLGSLPGMILEADINSGSRVLTAKSIESAEPGSLSIEKPKTGKKVSDEEFKSIVAEKMKEMGMEQGEGGNQVRIVIRHQ